MNLKNRMYRVKDAYLAPEVDEEFINGSPYGERSPKYNTFDYNEKCAIQRCKEQGGEWMVFIENIGGEPSYDFGMSDGLKVDEIFNAWGEIPSRVLEIVENRNGKVYVEGVSEDVTTIPERNYVEDSRRVKDARKIKDDAIEDYIKTLVAEIIITEDYGISERFPMKDNYPEGSVRKLESFIASVKYYSEATNTTPVIIPQTDYYRIVFGDANNETVGEIFYVIKQLPTDKLTNDMENLISIS